MYTSDPVTILVGNGGLPQGPEGYVFCSNQNETCTFSGTANVAFGVDGRFNYKYNVTGSIECNKGVFGNPASGTVKFCFVQDAGSPSVSITSPVSGSKFSPSSDIQFDVNATDSDGNIDSVQFRNGNTIIGVSKTDPFSFIWNNVPEGNYSITATAIDNEGKSFTSQAVSIIVGDVSSIDKPAFSNVEIYPNPVTEKLFISLKDNSSINASVSIYNNLGRILLQKNLTGQTNVLDLGFLPKGIYMLKLENRKENKFSKVIKN
jgi:hypothetical protein